MRRESWSFMPGLRVGIWLLVFFCFGGSPVAVAGVAAVADIEVFVRPGCPYCEAAKGYLVELHRRRPEIQIRLRDISQDAEALQELNELSHRFGIRPVGVPAFYLRGQLIVGFMSAEITGKAIELLLDRPAALAEGGVFGSGSVPETVAVPLLGRIDVRGLGLPIFTIVIGLVDGFNPCAMWVLLFLLSMLVNLRDRRKMFLIGGVFVAVSGLVYFAFMAAWLNLFFLIGAAPLIQVLLGTIAAAIGILNIKDFFAFGRGISVGIPAAVKPTIYDYVRRVLRAENLYGALATVVVLAVLVNTVELLCTAGLPAIYTRVLTSYALPGWAYYGYLALYNVAYMADDALMLVIAVVTLSREKLQEKGARWLKLISGLVMVALGLILVLAPEWLGQGASTSRDRNQDSLGSPTALDSGQSKS
jgi:glutaredoxin